MRSSASLDTAQLNALRAKIAELEALPAIEQERRQHLLAALRREEKSLRQYHHRLHGMAAQRAA